MQDTTAAIIGLGYVGLPLAILAQEKGWNVIGVDIDKQKIESVNEQRVPFEDHELQLQLAQYPITATTDFSSIKQAEIIVVAVPTPVTDTNAPDLSPLKRALESIAAHLKPGQTVIIESTINPGVMDEVVKPALRDITDIHIAHCPERINPGDPDWSVRNIPRVLGAYSGEAGKKALTFYKSVIEAPITLMASPTEAEAVKILENTFRDVNIAFVNEMARSFDKLHIDILNVIKGAATKPFGFMPHYPGNGVGGHCISVDPYYMIERGRQAGFDHEFLKLARKINEGMPAYTVSRLDEALTEKKIDLSSAQIALLGITYKKNVSDVRNSPALKIKEKLTEQGYTLEIFDPHVPKISTVSSLQEALEKSVAVVIGCDHDDIIQALNADTLSQAGIQVIIDGKNSLDKATLPSNIVYRGIGR